MHRRLLPRAFAALLGFIVLAASPAATSFAQETPEPYRSLPARLRARLADFPTVRAPTSGDALSIHTVALNQKPELYESGHAFSAVRFRAPERPGLDFIWAFSVPAAWRQWYILPAEADTDRRGFKNWLDGDRAYVGFDASEKNPVTLQSLSADYFEPGREYLLWFCQTNHTPEPAELKLVLCFATLPADATEWNHDAIETALRLQSAPVSTQADYFSSRGARVLLDRELFHPSDAASQMDHFLFTRRQTQFTGGGFYVTIETATPACHSSPALAAVIARHGPPDFTLTAAQLNRLNGEGAEPAGYDRHHYDYFVFETTAGDDTGPIQRVSSQFFNTAAARPSGADAGADTWTEVTIQGRDYRLFFKADREIARYIDWGEPGAMLLDGEVPAGDYQCHYPTGERMEKLSHDGEGNWTYESWHQSGPSYCRCTYKNGKLEGELVETYEDGRDRARLTYREGLPHGRLTQWNEAGEITRELDFVKGKPMPKNVDSTP